MRDTSIVRSNTCFAPWTWRECTRWKLNEARALHGLGRAYQARGDTAQATTFHAAALKLRRSAKDPGGLISSLIANGGLARDAW